MQVLHHKDRFALATEAYLWACDYVHGVSRLMKETILKNNGGSIKPVSLPIMQNRQQSV